MLEGYRLFLYQMLIRIMLPLNLQLVEKLGFSKALEQLTEATARGDTSTVVVETA
ncbi:hypothetical protein MKW92_040300, partial [Papaver armeniacum]